VIFETLSKEALNH